MLSRAGVCVSTINNATLFPPDSRRLLLAACALTHTRQSLPYWRMRLSQGAGFLPVVDHPNGPIQALKGSKAIYNDRWGSYHLSSG